MRIVRKGTDDISLSVIRLASWENVEPRLDMDRCKIIVKTCFAGLGHRSKYDSQDATV